MRLVLANKQTWHFDCPHCKKVEAFEVTHLISNRDSFGPWYCENCGMGVEGRIDGGTVEVELSDTKTEETLDLLRLPQQADPVYLVVRGFTILDTETGEVKGSSKEYWYESHTCPINTIAHAEAIILKDESDPHGIFDYLDSVKVESKEFDGTDFTVDEWRKLFPQIAKR